MVIKANMVNKAITTVMATVAMHIIRTSNNKAITIKDMIKVITARMVTMMRRTHRTATNDLQNTDWIM